MKKRRAKRPQPPPIAAVPVPYQVPPLTIDEVELRAELRQELGREPDEGTMRLRKLHLEVAHFFDRPGPDRDWMLRHILSIEWVLHWADLAFSKRQKRPWDEHEVFNGSFKAVIDFALERESMKG